MVELEETMPINVCGNCLHYREARRGQLGLCHPDIKIRPGLVNTKCPDFTLSKRVLSSSLSEVTELLGKIVGFDSIATTSLIKLISEDVSNLQTTGYRFGETVYVNMSNPNLEYVEAYYKFRIVGYNLHNGLMQLAHGNTIAHMYPRALVSESDYKSIEKDLRARGDIKVPKQMREQLNIKYRKVDSVDGELEITKDDTDVIFTVDLVDLGDNVFHAISTLVYVPIDHQEVTRIYTPELELEYEEVLYEWK